MATRRVQGVDMRPNTYTDKEKRDIAAEIKPISDADAVADFKKLCARDFAKPGLSRVGNKCVDGFTFAERLNTAGNKGISYYDLLFNGAAFGKKPWVQNIVRIAVARGDSENYAWLHLLRLYFGSVSAFRPLVAANIYDRFKPKCVLDPTMGWGGRLVGAMAAGVPRYVGIDNNEMLKAPYSNLVNLLSPLANTEIDLRFEDALLVDYSKIDYGMVLTSPPYYDLECYGGKESLYKSKADWNALFYEPLIKATYEGLALGGHFCLNVPQMIYDDVCVPILGPAHHFIELVKVSRGKYQEFIYVWCKIAATATATAAVEKSA